MRRINLWSSPRNVSTALMYAFAQRPDTQVVDEPLYGHYLKLNPTSLEHPARDEILRQMETDGRRVIEQVLLADYPKPVVIFKQMTHHLQALDRSFLQEMDHVLLIRNPRRIIHSFEKVIPEPAMEDIGIQMQWELFQELKTMGKMAAVVDARELLLNPENVLQQTCEALSIPFFQNMLHWEAGPRPEDGVWAPYWYSNVHKSTGFKAYRNVEFTLSESSEALARKCEPYYEKLLEVAIKAEE